MNITLTRRGPSAALSVVAIEVPGIDNIDMNEISNNTIRHLRPAPTMHELLRSGVPERRSNTMSLTVNMYLIAISSWN